MSKRTPKYAPLGEFLAELPRTKSAITLSFADIEEIVADALPSSASQYREWWSNQKGGSRAPHWQRAGFIVAAVDLSRKFVRFERGEIARNRKTDTPTKITNKEAERQAQPQSVLKDAGFAMIGQWALDGETIALDRDAPNDPAVYAHIVDGDIYYIGSASVGLKGRLHFYAKPGRTQRTSVRVNGLIRNKLRHGHKVWVIAAFPKNTSWKGLPVDTVVGLESGLVRNIRPPWNRRGVGA